MIALTGQNHANNTTLPTLPARNSAAPLPPPPRRRDLAVRSSLCSRGVRGRHKRDWLLAVLTHPHTRTHTPTLVLFFWRAFFTCSKLPPSSSCWQWGLKCCEGYINHRGWVHLGGGRLSPSRLHCEDTNALASSIIITFDTGDQAHNTHHIFFRSETLTLIVTITPLTLTNTHRHPTARRARAATTETRCCTRPTR